MSENIEFGRLWPPEAAGGQQSQLGRYGIEIARHRSASALHLTPLCDPMSQRVRS